MDTKKTIKRKPCIVIIRSCLTDKPVWVYQGASKEGARIAYWRACKREIERVRRWPEYMSKRATAVTRLLSSCMDKMSLEMSLTMEQKDAARCLQKLCKNGLQCHREFYDHIVEERRRRKEARAIRVKMRERDGKCGES